MLGLGRKNQVKAAEATARGSEAKYRFQQQDTRAEIERYEALYANYQSDIKQLASIKNENKNSISLYREQLDAGSIAVAAGIDLYRTQTDTRIAIIDARADIVTNCLAVSMLRGQLVPLERKN
jgi:adhesin transport system outer membrane protein